MKPAFDIIKAALGLPGSFLLTLACNCKRISRVRRAKSSPNPLALAERARHAHQPLRQR